MFIQIDFPLYQLRGSRVCLLDDDNDDDDDDDDDDSGDDDDDFFSFYVDISLNYY